MEVINSKQLLITTSLDCCARLWTWSGGFVGTFGQPSPWDITNSVDHRMGPFDVLMDPKTHTVPELQAIITDESVTDSQSNSNEGQYVVNLEGYAKEIFGPPSVILTNCRFVLWNLLSKFNGVLSLLVSEQGNLRNNSKSPTGTRISSR